ncbi:TetR/AcrR family transcriptional regulator [Alisedimentitalea sp. MJ-SS2]|uniref:TetR/AcrR family transcriptional regulator n=1 Tax=Aliisedimentitalea sp. MJ-SS2 TaxID=3049795 RepID=UPI00290D30A0|nr:TetR/AcrR family transcriptional regulator [Alisedimentitalea sp. MJ-SS2]MDU8928176.1 TetR/AcrR family transcriptional regulator [Alisedimentitalea sp. MJ-SS2]
MNVETPQRSRNSEDLWLAAAYDLLTESGVEAVKIMPLARRVGLSRTGFYWHFKDRDALLEAMIRRWEEKNTGNLVDRCEAFAETICEAMFNLFDCWLDADLFDARLDLAIRNWARNDPALQTRLDSADARRRAAVTAMFTRFGYDSDQAEVRALSVLYTQIGYISMQVSEDPVARIARMPAYIEVFTGERPTQSDFERFNSRHPLPA